MANDVAKTTEQTTALARIDSTPSALLAVAVQKDLDLEKLKGLMDLQERWEKNEASKAFFQALSDFQSEMPPLTKDATVDFSTSKGRTHYRHASLGAISEAIREPLHRHGLSYRFEIANAEDASKGLTVTCIVSHKAGHSERTKMGAPPDDSGNKNAIQSLGSTVTYMQRYTLIAALGLVTADDDTDGRPSMTGPAKHEPPAPKVPADFPPVASVGAPPADGVTVIEGTEEHPFDVSQLKQGQRVRFPEVTQVDGKFIHPLHVAGTVVVDDKSGDEPDDTWVGFSPVADIVRAGRSKKTGKPYCAIGNCSLEAPAGSGQGDLPLDEPIEGEVVEDTESPFDSTGALPVAEATSPADAAGGAPLSTHFAPRAGDRNIYEPSSGSGRTRKGGRMAQDGDAAGAPHVGEPREPLVGSAPAVTAAPPAPENINALRSECVKLERFLATDQKVPFADIADGYEEASGARSLYSKAITAEQMEAIRDWLRQWCANLVPEFDPAKDDGIPY